MPEIRFRYPESASPRNRYEPGIERVGRMFMELLFRPHRLHEVTSPDFVEQLPGEGITLRGLQALLDYRARFGDLTLLKADTIAVPSELSPTIPNANGERYAFSSVTEFTFNLPPDAPQFPTRVRMWESLDILPGNGPEGLLVHGRTYQPLGATGPLTGTQQHAFVAEQVVHFTSRGETLPMAPIEDVYATTFPGLRV